MDNEQQQQETGQSKLKRRMSQTLKLNVPNMQDKTLQELSNGSFQNGNMVIDSQGVRVIGSNNDELSNSLGAMSLQSLGNNSAMNVEEFVDKMVDNQPQQQSLQKDSDGFAIPMGKGKPKQQNNAQNNNNTDMTKSQFENNLQQEFQQHMQQKMQEEQVCKVNEQLGITDEDNTKSDVQTVLNIASFQIPFNEIKKISVIGAGSAGTVEKALHEPTDTYIALKSIPLNTDENFKKQINIELNTLMKCNCEHIVKCYGACLHQGNIAIALEFMDMGTLSDVAKKVGKVPEGILGIIIVQCLKGLEYLHNTLKVIHRDIKPQNLLVSSTGDVKIADFGVSGTIFTNQQKNTWLGTVTYMAPERFKGESYTADTDLWSLGITIVELALGYYPYSQEGKQNFTFWELLDEISNNDSPQLPSDFSDEMKDFISICLRKESGKRTTSSELLQHPLVQLYETLDKSFFRDWLEPLLQQ